MAKKKSTIRIRQTRSAIGRPRGQRETLRGLGLRRPHQVVEREDTDAVRGMAAKIPHLVQIVDEES